MHQQNFQLKVVSPCSESLDNMSAHPQGFYCHSCEKKVVDFTEKLPSEIAQFFTAHRNDNICGRFFEHQLEENYTVLDANRKIPSLKYAAGFLVSMLLSEQVVAENLALKPVTEQNSNASENNLPPKTLIIKGQVVNAATSKGVSNAQIIVSAKQTYYNGKTDANGFFEFGIPENYNPKTVITVQSASRATILSVMNLGQFMGNPAHQIQVHLTTTPQRPVQPVKIGKTHRVEVPKTLMGDTIMMGKPAIHKSQNK